MFSCENAIYADYVRTECDLGIDKIVMIKQTLDNIYVVLSIYMRDKSYTQSLSTINLFLLENKKNYLR